MSRYRVKCERRKDTASSKSVWYEYVEACSESVARSIARGKAKIAFPNEIIAVLEAKKL